MPVKPEHPNPRTNQGSYRKPAFSTTPRGSKANNSSHVTNKIEINQNNLPVKPWQIQYNDISE